MACLSQPLIANPDIAEKLNSYSHDYGGVLRDGSCVYRDGSSNLVFILSSPLAHRFKNIIKFLKFELQSEC